ncbi:MAG: hypothetical protein JWN49_165 [Parcubacteria group bacterium]|nr:hypothetical protein [Parcubacteria group bacterium]
MGREHAAQQGVLAHELAVHHLDLRRRERGHDIDRTRLLEDAVIVGRDQPMIRRQVLILRRDRDIGVPICRRAVTGREHDDAGDTEHRDCQTKVPEHNSSLFARN